MALLGEMLVERGAISVEQLHTGLAASRSGSDRLGTCLVDHGFIDESSLLEVLADQHGVPFVSQPVRCSRCSPISTAFPLYRNLCSSNFWTL